VLVEIVDDFEIDVGFEQGGRRAVRTFFMASRMFSSLMRPRPERLRNTPENLSVRASNMGLSVGR
jgi:hypothetical protein